METFILKDKIKLRQTLYLIGKSFTKFVNFETYSDIVELILKFIKVDIRIEKLRRVEKVYIFIVEANMNYVDCVN